MYLLLCSRIVLFCVEQSVNKKLTRSNFLGSKDAMNFFLTKYRAYNIVWPMGTNQRQLI